MNNNNKPAIEASKDIELTSEASKDLHAQQLDLLQCIKVTGAAAHDKIGDCEHDDY